MHRSKDRETRGQRERLALLGCDREGFMEEVAFPKETVATGCKKSMGKNLCHQG